MSDLSASARAAVLECLRVLAGAGGLGRDEAFVGSISRRDELTPGQALLCRQILARHDALLPPNLLATALSDEPDPPPVAVRRPRGRPPIGDKASTSTERSRRRRAAERVGVLELPVEVAARFRAVRDARRESAAETLGAALDALLST